MLNNHTRSDSTWVQTYTGKQWWPLDPRVGDFDIVDIAHALSLKCRFGGMVTDFYSVAQHSVLVSLAVPPADAKWGLLHDAAEAVLPDVASPIKRHLPGFCELEDQVLSVIAKQFGLDPEMPPSVKRADLILLETERRDLMATPPIPWKTSAGVKPLEIIIAPNRPRLAELNFLARFNDLFPEFIQQESYIYATGPADLPPRSLEV